MAGFLIYFLTSIIAYLGLIGGFALAHIAHEELNPGRKYFEAMKDFTLVIIMLLPLYLKEPSIGIMAVIIMGIYFKFWRGSTAVKIVYGIVGAVFAVLSKERIIFPITASVVFIFGLSIGTLCVMKHADKSKTWQLLYILGSNALFFATALPLYFSDL